MNAMDHVGLRLKKGLITCTHCGKIFYDLMKLEDGEMDICPNCGTHLKIETTTRKSCRDNEYFNIITTWHFGRIRISLFSISEKSSIPERRHRIV